MLFGIDSTIHHYVLITIYYHTVCIFIAAQCIGHNSTTTDNVIPFTLSLIYLYMRKGQVNVLDML